jgi:oligopeptide transport system substrate-binding protein
LGGCDRQSPEEAAAFQAGAQTSLLRRGNGGDPGSLDPQRAADHYSYEIQRDLFEGLVSESPDGAVIPGVAASWSVSDDGLTYRFTLRENARWSDGSSVEAGHFVTAFRRAVDPATASPAADMLRPIVHAEQILGDRADPAELAVNAIGPRELEITLSSPVAYFLSLLTHPVFFPRHPAAPAAFGTESAGVVGNGAYRLVSWVPNSRIEVVRNPHYWNSRSVQIERVQYYPVSSESSEYMRYRAGELDVTASVPVNNLDEIRRDRPSELRMAPNLSTLFLGFNLRRPPFAGNLDLRLALSLAIDRDVLARQVLKDAQIPAFGLVPAGTAEYQLQAYPWGALSTSDRRALARDYFSRAWKSQIAPLKLRIIYGNSEVVRSTLIAVAAMWKEALGIEVDIVSEEFRAFLQTQHDPEQWELIRMGWVADYNDASTFLDLFRESNPVNVFGYANSNFEQLLRSAELELDPLGRQRLLQEAERILLADAAFIPLFHVRTRKLVSPRVQGLELNPLNRMYSRHLRIVE